MIILASVHLLDGVVVVVITVVADALPVDYVVVGPVADGGNHAHDWRVGLSPSPDFRDPLRRLGVDAGAQPDHPAPVSAGDSIGMVIALDCPTDTVSRHPTQDALRPGSDYATGNGGWGLAQDTVRSWPGIATGSTGTRVGARRSSARTKFPGRLLDGEKGEERGPAAGYAIRDTLNKAHLGLNCR